VLKYQQSRIIRCYTFKNAEKESPLNRSVEELLKKDLLDGDRIGQTKTTKPSMLRSDELMVINNELDDEDIMSIKASLEDHYLLKDLSSTIM
jgi:hypothetical protein